MRKIIPATFAAVLFLTPILVVPFTSEIFEFNKLIFTYIASIIILFLWIAKSILNKKIIFRRTILDIPLLIFLLSQIISTVVSIDKTTSLFGYYSRFNGSLTSTISYLILYFAYVSNNTKKDTFFHFKCLGVSALLAATYGILEHFGIDKNLWVQDVVNRVFSTLGQPNWLAAFLTATIPLFWAHQLQKAQSKKPNHFGYLLKISSLAVFICLLFTKSRSGLLAFFVVDFVYTTFLFLYDKQNIKNALFSNLLYFAAAVIFGTSWTPAATNFFEHKASSIKSGVSQEIEIQNATDPGGTESADIRKIVWKGAIEIWRAYPLFGSGVETFAYSYFKYKPQEQNLVSEWDFIYNKAHNEYLNYLATTGILGLASYLVVVLGSLSIFYKIIFVKSKTKDLEVKTFTAAMLSGYLGILITNFFGFSVVAISQLFFLFPAFAISLTATQDKLAEDNSTKIDYIGWTYISVVFLGALLLIYFIVRMYKADIYYSSGRLLNDQAKFEEARMTLYKAIKSSPVTQPTYLDEMSKSALGIALNSFEKKDTQATKLFAETSLYEISQAIKISPQNLSLYKSRAATLIKLSDIDQNLISSAVETLVAAASLSPNDPKILYNLALVYARQKEYDKTIQTLKEATILKPNYKDAREALAFFYKSQGNTQEAKEELNYILENIIPDDPKAKSELENL